MAKVSRPLFGDAAHGLLSNTIAFKTGGRGSTVGRCPSPRVFKSQRVLKQQGLFKQCVADWKALSFHKKKQYWLEGRPDLSGFAYYLSIYAVAKCSTGFAAPSDQSFGDYFSSVNVAAFGKSLYLQDGYSYGSAVYGPYSLDVLKTVFSGMAAIQSACAYGYQASVFISLQPPGFAAPPGDDFLEVFNGDDLARFVGSGSFANTFLWVRIDFNKLT